MISIKLVEEIHETLIAQFGGSYGLRDIEALQSALARPFQTFDSRDLYSTVIDKAAALVESLLINHPFIDGNKRTAYVTLKIFLFTNGLNINASKDEKYEFIIDIASGKSKFAKIIEWLFDHVEKI